MAQFKVGDLFTVDPALFPASTRGVVFEVESVPGGRQKNYVGRPHNAAGRGVRAPEYAMRPHTPGAETEQQPQPPAPSFTVGAVVALRADAPDTRIPKSGLYVVLGEARGRVSDYRLVRLGGDGGRYWPRVPGAWLETVDMSDLSARLAG